MKPPTPKQLDTLRYIADYHREHGWPPTYREIAVHFGIGLKAAQDRITGCAERGVLKRRAPYKRFNLSLTDRGRELLMPEQAVDSAGNVYEKILLGGTP